MRRLITKAHINDYMQGLVTKRIASAMTSGSLSPSAASYIKLGTGIIQPLRAIAAMEIAGRQGVAWKQPESPGHVAATYYLNGRIMSIAGGATRSSATSSANGCSDSPASRATTQRRRSMRC